MRIDRISARTRCRPPDRAGFTIVELLVVITIIITLLAILLPSTATALAWADVAVCQSNLRQIGAATLSYGQDSFGWLPDSRKWITDFVGWGGWHRLPGAPRRIAPSAEGPGGLIYPYVQTEDVFVCRTFADVAKPYIPGNEISVFSYTMHEAIRWVGDWHGLALRELDDPKIQPASMLLVAEEAPYVPTAVASFDINNSCFGASRDPNPGAVIDGVATYHFPDNASFNTGSGNVLFFDGHAELRYMNETVDPKVLAFPADFAPSQWAD